MTNIDILLKGTQDLNLKLTEEDKARFLNYKELLKEWNEKINITTITQDSEIDIKHFLDSLTCLSLDLFEGNKTLIDIGTGGGFPGIPLKIMKDNLNITLLDSLNKRINFLNEVIKVLDLKGIKAIHGRAEELSRQTEYRENFSIAISRAVASLDTLSEYCLPFVKVGGHFIAMKGPDIEEELNSSRNAIKLLGGNVVETKIITLPESDIVHSLIVIEKIRQTSQKYPRGGGKPRKNPL
ncbi:16S rRNA (guanine(527)-N(7))-methyltransferase RsmG [Tissierella creatinophila]|uniref:Ribosomal RNA small subunit methyltransferase G n=1 Tax=Tissierella creatinophila DSM 6911 TaxID=1123403 RepID=A0A1U7M5Z7_TISCR|nr:16S rRNA (guanine(527)-N(7))-methyltransferase RsmG [Tissierella creatinophila]OLS02711.1 ribosomal RNA small subunit methyltransferase G [Tissierella creatinophila DSM 6911]